MRMQRPLEIHPIEPARKNGRRKGRASHNSPLEDQKIDICLNCTKKKCTGNCKKMKG